MSTYDLLTGRVRQIAYVAYALVGYALGATQLGYATAHVDQPQWLTITLAIFVFTGGTFGLVAGNNVPRDEKPKDPEATYEAVRGGS